MVINNRPHLKYAAILPCNLSLMARFADINVSQDSVATEARCGGIFHIHLTANLPRNLPVKHFFNRLRFDTITVMSQRSRCFGPPCSCYSIASRGRNGIYERDQLRTIRQNGETIDVRVRRKINHDERCYRRRIALI